MTVKVPESTRSSGGNCDDCEIKGPSIVPLIIAVVIVVAGILVLVWASGV